MVCILHPGDGKDGNQGFRLGAAALLGDVLRGLSPAQTGGVGTVASCGDRSRGLALCREGGALVGSFRIQSTTPSSVPLGQSLELSGPPLSHW